MKRTVSVLAALVAASSLAGAASGAVSPTKQIAALQKDVAALKKSVAKQTKQIKTLTNALNAAFYVDLCILGITADAAQSTWSTFDQTSGSSVFGPQQAIGDGGACTALKIPRQGVRTPPTISPFSALVSLITAPRTWLR